MNIALIVIIVLVVLIALYVINTRNALVVLRNKVKDQLSQIDVQLKRRTDLIPNLINTVKGYMAHEEKIINSITEARSNLVNAKTLTDKVKANDKLTESLNSLNIIVENYPDLKSNTNFIQLQDELAGTENRISNARREYNEAVKSYNQTISVFPGSIVANIFKFEKKPYFEVSETDKGVPNVEF